MGFSCGIIGLPNVGKSTLFNALTGLAKEAENYPFCTVDSNYGRVLVPDERLQRIARCFTPEKVTSTFLEFVDIAGLVKGAANGEGLGNQFLAHVQNTDAIAHVIRCFRDNNVAHVYETLDPVRDAEIIDTELILHDLEMVHKRYEKQAKVAKRGDKHAQDEVELLARVEKALAQGQCVRATGLDFQNLQLPLLTEKPLLFVANIGEEQIASLESNEHLNVLRKYAHTHSVPCVDICAQIEAELNDLCFEDRKAYLAELGLSARGLDRLIRVGYDLLHLITFFTTVGTEVRAWTVHVQTPAFKAAGKIHSDMERGFIRAEVISARSLIEIGSEQQARKLGLIRSEGRDYIIQDGDVIRFRFNV